MAEHVFNVSQALSFLPLSPVSPPSVGWGNLPELLLYGDQGDQSPWDSDAAKSLTQLASSRPPMPPPPPAHMSIPPKHHPTLHPHTKVPQHHPT